MAASHHNLWADYPKPDNLPPTVVSDPRLPLVSIVTPSYNQGRFIRETIDSVLCQDYPNIEYWVIDGGSTDETLSVLSEYEHDPRFHWISEPDQGQSDAINKGWSRCRGDILAWLNSDDLYLPGAIRSQMAFLQSHPDVDIVYGNASTIDTHGRRIGAIWSRRFVQRELLRRCFISQPTVFLRRGAIDRNGPLDPSFHYTMDYDYWLRASFHSSFAYNPAIIAAFRFHDTSKTVTTVMRFNPESERAIERFFAQATVPAALRQQYNRVYADLMLRLSVNCAKADDTANALRYLHRSISYQLFRPRLFWALLALFDVSGKWSLSRYLINIWNRFQAKEAR
jgi:glycosyltransferase involved in cell wall biosynthesis